MAELKRRVEAKVSEILYSQMQTVKLAQGLPSDNVLMVKAIQQYIDQTAESVTSALYFHHSFRETMLQVQQVQRQTQIEQRFLLMVLMVALLDRHKLDGVLPALDVPHMNFMDSHTLARHVTDALGEALKEVVKG